MIQNIFCIDPANFFTKKLYLQFFDEKLCNWKRVLLSPCKEIDTIISVLCLFYLQMIVAAEAKGGGWEKQSLWSGDPEYLQ